jgi:hypothetical protein
VRVLRLAHARDGALNEFPQFTTEIDGQTIHFMHIRSAEPGALPLVLNHGWPGSPVDFMKIIRPLSETFHVVVPSQPGFGFSIPLRETGWGVTRSAAAFTELMRCLGYERYGVYHGSGVANTMRLLDPGHVVGVHLSVEQTDRAKAICAGCPVRTECLTWALATNQVYACGTGPARTNAVTCTAPNDAAPANAAKPTTKKADDEPARPGAGTHHRANRCPHHR